VALESTIIAHGLPHPQNLQLAIDVSQIIRSRGGIPATIAIKDGVCRVGLTSEEIVDLCLAGNEGRAVKCSTRDLPLIVKMRSSSTSGKGRIQWGATTVAATMRIAHLAGIPTFVTGGTGGVHRGGETSLDISTDLLELSRTPVIVISAGIKSILDIRRTLEVLETYSVPVGTWQSTIFPAFFSPNSGIKSPATFHTAHDVALAYLAGKELGLSNGILVAVPNIDPAGTHVEIAIQEAIAQANDAGITGRDITPYILQTVANKTCGDSLRSNISLVKRNAEVGVDIANSISTLLLERKEKENTTTTVAIQSSSLTPTSKIIMPQQQQQEEQKVLSKRPRVVCVGGSVIDTIATSNSYLPGTSNPGIIHRSYGGVGRNITEVLGRLGSLPLFYTAIGDRCHVGSEMITQLVNDCNVLITVESVHVAPNSNTAQYLALLDNTNDLVGGVADMDVLSTIPIPTVEDLQGVELLVLDANVPLDKLITIVTNGVSARCQICFDPTSVPKAKILSTSNEFVKCLNYIFPNQDEILAMAKLVVSKTTNNYDELVNDDNNDNGDNQHLRDAASILLSRMNTNFAHIIITLGKSGVLLASSTTNGGGPKFTHFPVPNSITTIKSSNGAGDTLCGAFLHAILQGASVEDAIVFGMKASLLSLDCAECAISPLLSTLKYIKS
jgi:pseudouridine-5'-phosphate glycosidase/sugar/nucleoside kinase (ribokinase family)